MPASGDGRLNEPMTATESTAPRLPTLGVSAVASRPGAVLPDAVERTQPMTDTACRKCKTVPPDEEGVTAYRCETCGHWNDLKARAASKDKRPTIPMWRVRCGQLSKKNPIQVIDNGDGMITEPRSLWCSRPKIGPFESFHETRQAAVIHILAEAQRDVNRADAELTKARRRLRSAQLRFQNEVVAAGR